MTQEELWRDLGTMRQIHYEFCEMVKKLRDAQKELDTCSIGDYGFRQHCATQLESEVDKYLANYFKK